MCIEGGRVERPCRVCIEGDRVVCVSRATVSCVYRGRPCRVHRGWTWKEARPSYATPSCPVTPGFQRHPLKARRSVQKLQEAMATVSATTTGLRRRATGTTARRRPAQAAVACTAPRPRTGAARVKRLPAAAPLPAATAMATMVATEGRLTRALPRTDSMGGMKNGLEKGGGAAARRGRWQRCLRQMKRSREGLRPALSAQQPPRRFEEMKQRATVTRRPVVVVGSRLSHRLLPTLATKLALAFSGVLTGTRRGAQPFPTPSTPPLKSLCDKLNTPTFVPLHPQPCTPASAFCVAA